MRAWQAALAAGIVGLGAGTATGQEGGAPAQELVPPPAEAAAPTWHVFTRSDTTRYLIDMNSIRREGDEARVRIARVSMRKPSGDFSHTVDDFGVRCRTSEVHVETTTEVFEDGETAETYPADEPWSQAGAGTFDEAIKEIGCGEKVPSSQAYPAVRAYIEAGRP